MRKLTSALDVMMAVEYAAEEKVLSEISPDGDTCQEWGAFLWALTLV